MIGSEDLHFSPVPFSAQILNPDGLPCCILTRNGASLV
jgi:hypothetical protein